MEKKPSFSAVYERVAEPAQSSNNPGLFGLIELLTHFVELVSRDCLTISGAGLFELVGTLLAELITVPPGLGDAPDSASMVFTEGSVELVDIGTGTTVD